MENTIKSRFKVLLVDDTPENIDILNSVLSEYSRLVALNGEKAIQLATSKLPDLILLDIMMPDMDGYEVCKVLKEQNATKDIPIIFITSKTDPKSIVKGFDKGAVDYVTKPFNISELKARVNTQLTLKKSQDDIRKYLLEIEEKNKSISDSINYAKRIQEASHPAIAYLDEILNEYFILYKPKDIVSGDFYWIKKIDNKLVIIIADCTGHGVPGAFMSMFGTAFLNEIVNRDNVTKPSIILDKLREKVIVSLKQEDNDDVKDGMDISIVTIDSENKKLEFAGAKNHIYLLRDKELNKIKADNMPVSIYPKMDPFNNNEIDLQKGDVFYLFSDGYGDQFGGENGKKLGRKAFTQLMIEHHGKAMNKQKEEFEKYFDTWKGEGEQIDDVLVFGIRI